jgi:hypothetical protein
MKQFYSAALGVLLSVSVCQAQQFFAPGFALTATGDTLRGEFREESNTRVEFRHPSTGVRKSFGVGDLRSYTTEGIFHTVATWQEDDGTTGRSFLRLRLRGYVSLYSFPKEKGEFRYLMQLPNGTFVPLRGNQAYSKLRLLLNECDDPTFEYRTQSKLFFYGLSFFENAISAYNACVRPDLTPQNGKAKRPFHFEAGITAGASRNHWVYFFGARNVIPTLPASQAASAAIRPVIGGYFMISPQKRLSVTLEANYTSYKGSLMVVYPTSLNPRTESNYFFEEAYVAAPVTMRYVWLDRAVRGYVSAGAAFVLPTHQRTQRNVVGSIDTYDLPRLDSGWGFGFLAGLGVDGRIAGKRRIFAELRAQRHSVTQGVTRVALSYSVQALVGVSLFQK